MATCGNKNRLSSEAAFDAALGVPITYWLIGIFVVLGIMRGVEAGLDMEWMIYGFFGFGAVAWMFVLFCVVHALKAPDGRCLLAYLSIILLFLFGISIAIGYKAMLIWIS